MKDLVRKFEDADTKKDVFKYIICKIRLNHPNKLEKPAPSIAFHPVNIKSELRKSSMR